MKNTLIIEKINNINDHYNHPSYSLEKKLISEIRMGFLEQAMQTLHEINKLERPRLSPDRLRSTKNSLIISCALYTRAVIDGGINAEDAFDQSDMFIKHIESVDRERELLQFDYEMVEQFIDLVNTNKSKMYPYPVNKIVSYIHQHTTEIITVKDLAKMVHMSPDYLSRLFSKEVGMTIKDYIHYVKIEIAKYFLEFDTMSVTDISTLLDFCNPGYFSTIFKRYAGLSPLNFRKKYHSS